MLSEARSMVGAKGTATSKNGLGTRSLRSFGSWVALVAPVAIGWGFTVDDAWISARVAEHWSHGAGYRFNATGPIVDAVTPLGWAQLMAQLGGNTLSARVLRVRWLSVAFWALTAVVVANRLGRESGWRHLLVLIPWALCLPFGAWLGAGMETGLVINLCTWAVLWPRAAPWCAGLAAAFRPELMPWACALMFASEASPRSRALKVVRMLALPGLVACVRYWAFGSVLPLAIYAKPSDPTDGIAYVWGALRFTGMPLLLVSLGWKRLSRYERGMGVALLVHTGGMTLAGGDWMSLFRLAIPVLPSALLLACRLAEVTAWPATLARTVVATGFVALLLRTHGAAARGVWQQRVELITQARPWLEHAATIGTLDVGWVGAASRASVIDFAGVTDPRVAHLPGGHTSKQLPPVFLSERGIDTLVLLTESEVPARIVERRVLHLALEEQFRLRATILLAGTPQAYQVWERGGPTE